MNRDLGYFVLLSAIGGVCVVIIGLLGSSQAEAVDAEGKILVGVPFIMSCIVGIILAFRPGWMGKRPRERGNSVTAVRKSRGIKGHHPDCGRFESHVVNIGGRTFCTGCLGLAVGATMSIMLMLVYMIDRSEFSSTSVITFLMIGLALVALALVEAALTRGGFIHVLANMLLVLGFLLTVVSVFQLSGKPFYSWVVIIISFLWLETRIQIANWRHRSICSSCSEGCKTYEKTSA